jgi:hypothetical protein
MGRLDRRGLALAAVVAVGLLAAPSGSAGATNGHPRIAPVPSLQPAATQREWRRLVQAPKRSFAATPSCRPLRAVFYAASDWLRLATKLAAQASPCAQYYVSIPPLAAAKTQFRTDQAWRIRALGLNFHALAEVHMPGWRAWVKDNNATWYGAGVEARRRMHDAGFLVGAGDGWIVNELSSGVRRGLPGAREEAREFVRGLYDGYGGPPVKGGVFDIGISQTGAGPGAIDLSLYKAQLESFFADDAFWQDMSRYVADWSQELYGNIHNFAVPGVSLADRRSALEEWLEHQLVHARLGGAGTAAAATFLEDAYSPLANAAWQWDTGQGFGFTLVPPTLMGQFVSAQVYALRHFSASDAQARDHWGFAWAPRNGSSMSSADFAAGTAAVQERLAAAIHDSGVTDDPANPGSGACAPLDSCGGEVADAWSNDAWRTFGYWGQLALSLTGSVPATTAGGEIGPLTVQTRLGGNPHSTPSALSVSLSSSSPAGGFSTSPLGPWVATLTLTIPAGGDSAAPVYYSDTAAGSPTLTAAAIGTAAGTMTAMVAPGPAASVTISPSSVTLRANATQAFAATVADAFGNAVPADGVLWSVTPAALGTSSQASGGSTVFRALGTGHGTVVATVDGVSASAEVSVAAGATHHPVRKCLVPRLLGLGLRSATALLKDRHCSLGKVTRTYSRRIPRGRIATQRPAAGTRLRAGAKVGVTVSRGRRG